MRGDGHMGIPIPTYIKSITDVEFTCSSMTFRKWTRSLNYRSLPPKAFGKPPVECLIHCHLLTPRTKADFAFSAEINDSLRLSMCKDYQLEIKRRPVHWRYLVKSKHRRRLIHRKAISFITVFLAVRVPSLLVLVIWNWIRSFSLPKSKLLFAHASFIRILSFWFCTSHQVGLLKDVMMMTTTVASYTCCLSSLSSFKDLSRFESFCTWFICKRECEDEVEILCLFTPLYPSRPQCVHTPIFEGRKKFYVQFFS